MLCVRDVLAPVFAVSSDAHPPVHLTQRDVVFAVFSDLKHKEGFSGLVTSQEAFLYPRRIFADLLSRQTGSPLSSRESAKAALEHMLRESIEVLPVVDEGVGFVGAVTITSAMKGLLERLKNHDMLTDLPNRWAFVDRIEAALARSSSRPSRMVAVMTVDVDHFTMVNQSFGHDVGDALLRAGAERLASVVDEAGFVAHLGGDEFGVVLNKMTQPDAIIGLAQRVVNAFRQGIALGSESLIRTVSVGVALYPDVEAKSAREMIRMADSAMHHAKAEGRDRFVLYTRNLADAAKLRLELVNDLRGGVERGEFEAHFQPVIDVDSQRVVSVEALMRWRHLGRERLISPEVFIPLAEETGLIVDLGRWILEEACRNVQSWPGELSIAVNVSAVQLLRAELFVSELEAILQETGLASERLILEMTESVLLKDASATKRILEKLRALGVRVALDDFGTGYSSLSYLAQFRTDILKIDQSIVQGTGHRESQIILESVIALSRSLEIDVIAEGVESQIQLDFLKERGCQRVQGFLFARPMPAHELAVWIQNQKLSSSS